MTNSENNPLDQETLLRLLDEFEAPPVSLDFNRRLWQKLEAAPPPSFWDLARTWLKPAIPLAVIAALVIAGFTFDHRPATPGMTTLDADRMERTLEDIQLLGQFEKTPDGDPAV